MKKAKKIIILYILIIQVTYLKIRYYKNEVKIKILESILSFDKKLDNKIYRRKINILAIIFLIICINILIKI
jgi:hypothetical protein